MVWEHANYLQSKSWFNIRGGLFASSFLKASLNYSFLKNKPKNFWISEYINYDSLRICKYFYELHTHRFSQITNTIISFTSPYNDYLFLSVNRNTNIALPGKVNFFELNSISFCSFHYYFKKFRKKQRKPKFIDHRRKRLPVLASRLLSAAYLKKTDQSTKPSVLLSTNYKNIFSRVYLHQRKAKKKAGWVLRKIKAFFWKSIYKLPLLANYLKRLRLKQKSSSFYTALETSGWESQQPVLRYSTLRKKTSDLRVRRFVSNRFDELEGQNNPVFYKYRMSPRKSIRASHPLYKKYTEFYSNGSLVRFRCKFWKRNPAAFHRRGLKACWVATPRWIKTLEKSYFWNSMLNLSQKPLLFFWKSRPFFKKKHFYLYPVQKFLRAGASDFVKTPKKIKSKLFNIKNLF